MKVAVSRRERLVLQIAAANERLRVALVFERSAEKSVSRTRNVAETAKAVHGLRSLRHKLATRGWDGASAEWSRTLTRLQAAREWLDVLLLRLSDLKEDPCPAPKKKTCRK
jgi:hypothetical protein